jgi:hypothetical protein
MFVVVTLVRSAESLPTVDGVAPAAAARETICGRVVFNVGLVLFEDMQG